ncbi:MAG: hypothetical protein LBM78_00630 [Clostridiales bacterium]|jgi:hypothetical protein|nr:hypothetical protein [Clostridiales bacterium]
MSQITSPTGWTVEQTKRLFALCAEAQSKEQGLRVAFERIAAETGRKANSVRNYYYAHLKTFHLMPALSDALGISVAGPKEATFVTFGEGEAEQLVATILKEQAAGKSVRRITQELGRGDKSLTLRLQNKYRSIVFGRKRVAEEIMRKLREEQATFFNPYTRQIVQKGVEAPPDEKSLLENLAAVTDILGEDSVKTLFVGLARLASIAASTTGGVHAQKPAEKPAATDRLREINTFFLQKAEADKIKSLSDYVKELKKALAT